MRGLRAHGRFQKRARPHGIEDPQLREPLGVGSGRLGARGDGGAERPLLLLREHSRAQARAEARSGAGDELEQLRLGAGLVQGGEGLAVGGGLHAHVEAQPPGRGRSESEVRAHDHAIGPEVGTYPGEALGPQVVGVLE